MNKLLITLVLFAMSKPAFSQKKVENNIWHLVIVDRANLKGIEGATVNASKENTFVTNSDGSVDIYKNILSQPDIVRVSCIGYKTLLLKVNGKYPDSLQLSASIQILKEVNVIANNRDIVLGNTSIPYTGGYLPGPDQEIAEYIPNNKKISGTVISAEFILLNGHKGITKPFKINLYSKNKNSLFPQDKLIMDSIIVYNPMGNVAVSVDLSKYDIKMPEDGLFVSFQTLSRHWYEKDRIKVNGREFFCIPGIKGVFKNGQFHFDEDLKYRVQYSLLRDIRDGSNWNRFDYGTDFAIGLTINSQ